jgi:hypothetical protein
MRVVVYSKGSARQKSLKRTKGEKPQGCSCACKFLEGGGEHRRSTGACPLGRCECVIQTFVRFSRHVTNTQWNSSPDYYKGFQRRLPSPIGCSGWDSRRWEDHAGVWPSQAELECACGLSLHVREHLGDVLWSIRGEH